MAQDPRIASSRDNPVRLISMKVAGSAAFSGRREQCGWWGGFEVSLSHQDLTHYWTACDRLAAKVHHRLTPQPRLLDPISAADNLFQLNDLLAEAALDSKTQVELRLLRRHNQALERRVHALESLVRTDPQLDAASERHNRLAVEEVAEHRHAVAEVFAATFGPHPLQIRVESNAPDDEFDATLVLDLRKGEPQALREARARGARADFLAHLSQVIPSRILDRIDFRFLFP